MTSRPTLCAFLAAFCLTATLQAGPASPSRTIETALSEVPDARVFARRLADEVEPEDLARTLLARRDLVPPVLERLGAALDEKRSPALVTYLTALARAASREVAATGWDADTVDLLLTVQLVDPLRFVEDAPFRERVLSFLGRSLDESVTDALRDRLLFELNHVRGFGFEASEAIESAWGAVPRSSTGRSLPYAFGDLRVPGPSAKIETSIYSLPSQYFDAVEAGRFLDAVERWAPGRTIVVLADLPLRERLLERSSPERPGRTVYLETHGRAYTPWVRDPLLLTRRGGNQVVALARPNLQRRREDDSFLARELVQGLPPELDLAWGEARWVLAPVPFHNGQVLLTEDAVWLSLHTLELRILELLGLERVPVASFATGPGLDRYLGAARTAAAELAVLYGRPARFVHAEPREGTDAERAAAMAGLGGGAGFDLDSLLTLLPPAAPGEHPVALVADPRLGEALLKRASPEEWRAFAVSYRLLVEPSTLPSVLKRYQAGPRVRRLALFLDEVAGHLAREGFTVRRLAHLLVPVELLPEREELDYPDFQLTWNNVVLDGAPGCRTRAEGFASGLEPGDREARRTYEASGVELELLPALAPSIVRNGGYRCASNHLRRDPLPKRDGGD